jgi:spore coat protein SA
MKVGFIAQPWEHVSSPAEAGSLLIWTYQVTKRLALACDIVIYSRSRCCFRKEVKYKDRIEYRYMPGGSQRVLEALLYRLGMLIKPRRRYGGKSKRPRFSSVLTYLGYILLVALDLRKQQCSIVHIHNFSQFAPIIRFFNPRTKIVLHMHCEWLTQLDRTMIERRLRSTDLVIGCSDYITAKVRAAFPHLPVHYATVYNGASADHDTHRGSKPDGDATLRLLFVGRVSPEKGVHVLLDAIAELLPYHPSLHLDIIGSHRSLQLDYIVALSDDPKVQALGRFYSHFNPGRSYAAQLHSRIKATSGMVNAVSFLGRIPHSTVLAYYQKADLVVNPSLSEAFGMSLVEAMAAEVPVVASRVGGMVDIVEEGKTGLLVEAGDSHALAQAIRMLTQDKHWSQQMGKAGRQRVLMHFTWDKIAADLYSAHQEIMRNHG